MSTGRHLKRSNLFLVRLWEEETEEGEREWCGKVQRVVDGESHQFRDWQGLVELLLVMLSGNRSERSPDDILQ